MNIIQVQRLSDFPQGPVFGAQMKSIEEVERWAKQSKAETVWVYIHKPNKAGVQLVTAVRMVVEEAKRIEDASERLLAQAEASL